MQLATVRAALLIVATATAARAQDPAPIVEDVIWPRLSRQGSTFAYARWVAMPAGSDPAALVCLERVDVLPPKPLGCEVAPAPGEHTYMSFSLDYTPKDDAEVRAYALDDFNLNTALRSEYSENAARLPMTPPGRPVVKSSGPP